VGWSAEGRVCPLPLPPPVLLARLRSEDDAAAGGAPFTDRLVAKFGLPVAGWRGRPSARHIEQEPRAHA
jgi:hypothetical protein